MSLLFGSSDTAQSTQLARLIKRKAARKLASRIYTTDLPAMLCYATSRVGRGRGLLGLTPPQPPGVAEKPTAYTMPEDRETAMVKLAELANSMHHHHRLTDSPP